MKYRIPLTAAAVTAALLATGLAWANGFNDSSGSPSSTSSTSTSSTSTSSTSTSPTVTTSAPSPLAPTASTATTAPLTASRTSSTELIQDGASRTFVIGDAGTVLLGRSGSSLRIIAATPNAGWASEVEVASGREVEGDFRSGVLRVKYNFELEDGAVRVRIENRDDGNDRDDVAGDNDDDDRRQGDDDDSSGPGSGDGDDDNSGSGHGGDDDDDGDDHDSSGPGSGGADDSDDDD